MRIPNEIIAARGLKILPRWRALLKFIERTGVIIHGPGLRYREMPDGTHVYATSSFVAWSHPWKATINGDLVTINEGEVNGISPGIGGVRLNGKDDDGVVVFDSPKLSIEEGRRNRWSRKTSFIALRIQLGDGNIALDNPELTSIVHVESLDSTEAIGYHALTRLEWIDGAVLRSFPISHFNLQHQLIADAGGGQSRHFFFPA